MRRITPARVVLAAAAAAALALAATAAARTESPERTTAKQPILIGAVVDLTKGMAPFDAPALLAAQIEIKAINAKGGVNGRPLKLIYLNDQLDAQYASPGRVRTSDAPLLIGNSLDPRWLTTFSGDLKVGPNADQTPYYAFVGLIDELRVSSRARADFPYARGE